MKKLLSLFVILLSAAASYSQNVTVDKNGNYVQTKQLSAPVDSVTKKTFTDYDNVVHPVYKTKTGREYIIRTSKATGNKYRYYFKIG